MNNHYFWKNEKVSLRIIEEKDAEVLYEILCDTTLRMQAEGGIALPATQEMAEDMALYGIEMTNEGKAYWFAVLDNGNRMVGYAVLGYIDERNGNAQCDVTILPQYRRKGYGRAAYDILLRYAFYERRLHKVNCFVMEGNNEGKEFLSALGFCLEAYRPEMFFSHKKYFGQFYYGILKDEFEKGVFRPGYDEKIPDSDLGKKENDVLDFPSLFEERHNFWQLEDINLRDMTEEDYYKNREMLFDSMEARFYDNDVKLPMLTDELTKREETYMYFGGDGDRIEFSVTNRKGQYLGNLNLHSIDRKNGTFSVSLYFLKNARNKGYAVKSMALLVKYAFEELRLNKMNICVNAGNESSARVMRKLGCSVEGVWRENVYYDGKYVDVILFGVTKKTFFERFEEKKYKK